MREPRRVAYNTAMEEDEHDEHDEHPVKQQGRMKRFSKWLEAHPFVMLLLVLGAFEAWVLISQFYWFVIAPVMQRHGMWVPPPKDLG